MRGGESALGGNKARNWNRGGDWAVAELRNSLEEKEWEEKEEGEQEEEKEEGNEDAAQRRNLQK